MNKKERISTTQWCVLVFICSMAIKMFMVPALLVKVSKNDSIFVMCFYLLLEIINTLLVVLTAKRNPDKTYYEILKTAFGNVCSKIIIVYFTVFLLVKYLLILSEIKVFFSVSVYDSINWKVMILPIIALCITYANKTLRAIGRSAEIFVPIIITSTLILCVFLIGNIDMSNLLPFFDNGLQDFLRGIDTFPVWFGDVSLLLICLGNIKMTKKTVVFTVVSRVASALLVVSFSMIMFATYCDIPHLVDYGHNVSSMTQYSVGGNDFGRFDYIVYCFWLFSVFIKLSLIFYVCVRNVSFVINKKNNAVISLVLGAVCYVLTSFVLRNENITYTLCTSAFKYFLIPAEFLLPILVFVLARAKYEKATMSEGVQVDEKTA